MSHQLLLWCAAAGQEQCANQWHSISAAGDLCGRMIPSSTPQLGTYMEHSLILGDFLSAFGLRLAVVTCHHHHLW